MKILAICPTIYPKKFSKMYDSYKSTCSENIELLAIDEIGSITKIFNEAFESNPDYDFYFMMNDDILFKTPLWDMKLANKGKVSYGNDLFQGENLCTFPMIDGDIVRALGWLQMPKLERYCGDVIWKFMANRLDILEYHPEVIIEHLWEGADAEINKKDMERFAEWLSVSQRDINKVKGCLDAWK